MAAMLRVLRSLPKTRARAICQHREVFIGQVRCASLVNVERQGQLAMIELNRKPVNSFSLEFLAEINTNLERLENDKECHGLIVTSGLPKVFSAGLDLVKEVYKPDVKRLGLFWKRFQEMWLRLYGSRLVTMAAINGHALAGGCVVGLACDYRVIGDGLEIGLVELEAGVPVPRWVYSNLVNVVGRRAAEKAVLSSRRYGSEDALVIGMVDQVVSKDKVLSEAKKEMEKLLIHPVKPREITKRIMRKQFVETLENSREEDIKEFVDCILDEDVQKSVGMQIERLKQRS